MGRKNKNKNPNRNKFGQQKRDRDTQPGFRGSYDAIPSENALYERFYKESTVVPEEEWEDFWGALKRTLPTTFRFTGSRGHALSTLKTLQDIHIPHLRGVVWDGQQVDPPAALPWYPDNLAWGTAVGKQTIRRCPPFKKFQEFLVAETTVGNISRQEAVSMIPPLLMDIYPHHTVLDMCAAPGSKTAQLVEMIHNREESAVEAAAAEPGEECRASEGEVGGRATGLVIANDADYRRSHMLIHQTKRLNSPNLIVTNHDATMFPSLLTSREQEGAQKQYLKFDRILADVPCTGDGTARKNYSVWKDWNPHSAFNLHAIQIRILVRGLQMLKVGGRLVYSTCSMNPIENEAVVQAAIDRCGGLDKVEILDVSHRLPELKRKPGLKGGWKVMDKDRTWYTSFDEVLRDDSDRETRVGRITRSMFPTEDGKSEDDPTRIPLERCVRIYPHLQDTGGFFITVLRKKEEIRAIKPEDTKQQRVATLKAEQGVADSSSISRNDVAAEGALTPMEEQASVMEESITNIGESAAPSTLVPVGKTTPSPPLSPGKRKPESPIPAPALKKLKADNILSTFTLELGSGSATTALGGSSTAKGKGPPQEEPFKYLPPDHSVLKQIDEFYQLSSRFPHTCFMVRNAEALPTRAIYFTSHLAKLILEANEGRGVKFVHCGVKAFMKQDIQSPEVCPWRIQSEGLGIVAPWIGDSRVIHAKKRGTVHALLQELFPKVNDPADAAEEKNAETPKDKKTIGEIESQVRNISMGCCVLKVEKAEGEFTDNMILPLWKSRYSCNLMLPKEERKAMLLRLFDDTSEIRDSTAKNHHSHRDAQKVVPLEPTHVDANMTDAELLGEPVAENPVSNIDTANRNAAPRHHGQEEGGIQLGLMSEGQMLEGDGGAPVVAGHTGNKAPTEDELREEVRQQDREREEKLVKEQALENVEI